MRGEMFGTRLGLAEESTAVNDNRFFFPCTIDITSLSCDLSISKDGLDTIDHGFTISGNDVYLCSSGKPAGSLRGEKLPFFCTAPTMQNVMCISGSLLEGNILRLLV
jgi:hypothetical protein